MGYNRIKIDHDRIVFRIKMEYVRIKTGST